jgi:hypothetical protein
MTQVIKKRRVTFCFAIKGAKATRHRLVLPVSGYTETGIAVVSNVSLAVLEAACYYIPDSG